MWNDSQDSRNMSQEGKQFNSITTNLHWHEYTTDLFGALFNRDGQAMRNESNL
jgi:hypothetical protein